MKPQYHTDPNGSLWESSSNGWTQIMDNVTVTGHGAKPIDNSRMAILFGGGQKLRDDNIDYHKYKNYQATFEQQALRNGIDQTRKKWEDAGWDKDRLDKFVRGAQAEKEFRQNSYAAVIVLLSPFAIEGAISYAPQGYTLTKEIIFEGEFGFII